MKRLPKAAYTLEFKLEALRRVRGGEPVRKVAREIGQERGYPRQYEHPELLGAMRKIAEVCLKHEVVLGHPHVTAKNHERVLKEGFRFLMSAPQRSFGVVGQAREMAGY